MNSQAGGRVFKEATGADDWPERGVYYLFEPNEYCDGHPSTPRVVRVGTHMVSKGSKATFWNRLRTHKGQANGTGNHRASVFRRHVGEALVAKRLELAQTTWGKGQSAKREIIEQEETLEREVSNIIGKMKIVWLDIPDEAGPDSDRSFIEKNSIALLSKQGAQTYPPSPSWLGHFSPTQAIRKSGLWNVDYVNYKYDDRFLRIFREYVNITMGKKSKPKSSLAPKDWYLADKGEIGRGQLFLFGDKHND